MKWLGTGEFYALACAFLWAYGVILFRQSGEFLSPVVLNAFKSVVGLILFMVTSLVLGVPFFPEERTASDWAITLASGVLGIGLADTLFFRALNSIGAGRVAIVDCLYSPSVVLCSYLYLAEPLPATLFLAMGLMIGAILLGVAPPGGTWSRRSIGQAGGVSDTISRRKWIKGFVYAMTAIFLTAAAIVVVKPILERSSVWWVATTRLFGGVVFLVVQVGLSRRRAEVLPALAHVRTWRVALPATLVGTYLGFLFWNLGMKLTLASLASVLNQTANIMVLPLARLVLLEPLGWRQWSAIVLGFSGAVVALL